jgi:hypothetical protein
VLLLLLGTYARRHHAAGMPTESNALVTGAGTITVNGSYIPMGTSGGKTYYNMEGTSDDPTVNAIVWAGSAWQILDDRGTVMYSAPNGDSFPWEATEWITQASGINPPPIVTEA